MTDLLTRGQLEMLAQTLNADPADLAGLTRLGAQNLRELRERISDRLFDAHAATFARVSKLAPLVPNALAAKVVLEAVPAEVGGRAGGAIGLDHPDRAAGLLAKLTPEYMADAAPFLDPRAIPVLAPRVPAEVLVPASNELLRRRDYVTSARFVEHATDELVRGFERGIADDEGLLRTAALTPSADRLNDVVRVLPPERRVAIILAASASSDETLIAGISVLSRLEPELRRELGDRFLDDLDATGLDRLLAVATRGEAVVELLTVLSAVDQRHLRSIADRLRQGDAGVVGALSEQATTPEARRTLHAVGESLEPGERSDLLDLVDRTK
ncbi:hypothetical protein [Nocardia lijiangensis]|uniref:hypothetical protein n=1 Tax=Nocardia lijiangensis TaxID=299618 RepID=UPI00083544C5|nr:hypothetical protein [Nocardia lijiangensis]